jgi:hypothetical protein
VRPESYNDRLYRPDGTGLLPVPLAQAPIGELPGDTATGADWTSGWYRMQVAAEFHPMVRTFIDDRRSGPLRSPVFRFLPFEIRDPMPEATTVVLRYGSASNPDAGYPALLHWSLGRGHVAWFNSSADSDWSLFASTAPAFFPLVWDVVSYLTQERGADHELAIGDAIRKSVPAASTCRRSSSTATSPCHPSRTRRRPASMRWRWRSTTSNSRPASCSR